MNTDDIMRMAQEAGAFVLGDFIEAGEMDIERFANLVVAAIDNKYPIKFTHEQYNAVIDAAVADGVAEGCDVVAKWMMQHEYATGHGDTIKDLLEELEWQIEEQWECAAAAEREACAQIAHDTYEGFGVDAKGVDFVKQRIIDQIQARGRNETTQT